MNKLAFVISVWSMISTILAYYIGYRLGQKNTDKAKDLNINFIYNILQKVIDETEEVNCDMKDFIGSIKKDSRFKL